MAQKFLVLLLFALIPLFAEPPHRLFHNAWRDIPSICRSWLSRSQTYWYPEPEFPRKEAEGIPILLVHGYLHDNSAWLSLRDKLETKELGPIFSPCLMNSTGDIAQSALEVSQIVDFILKETGKDRVILVGHSMGGLVSAYAAEFLLPEGKIAGVITMGTPFRGTIVARLGFTQAARQMELNNPFLQKLVYRMKNHPKTEYYCIGSSRDEVVIPSKNAFFRNPEEDHPNDFLYDNVGHQGFLFSEEVLSDIAAVIKLINKN